MNEENIDQRIIQYVLGELSAYEMSKLEMEMRMDEDMLAKYEQYVDLHSKTKHLPIIKSKTSQQIRFDQWLDEEIQKEHSTIKKVGKTIKLGSWIKYGIAASIALLLGFFGTNMYRDTIKPQEQIVVDAEAKDEYYQMISSSSTMGKIKEINNSIKNRDLDPNVRDVLIQLMQNDPSSNVRLTVVEGLSAYNQDEVIKSSIIAALKTEKTPIVQMAMINALVHIKEPNAKIHLQELIDKEGVDPYVKDEARLGIISI